MERTGNEKGRLEVRVGILETKVDSLDKRVEEGFKETKGAIEKLDSKFDAKFDRLTNTIIGAVIAIAGLVGANATGFLGG